MFPTAHHPQPKSVEPTPEFDYTVYEEELGVLDELHGTEDFMDLLRMVTSDSDSDSVVVDDETGGANGSVGPEDNQDSESESEMD